MVEPVALGIAAEPAAETSLEAAEAALATASGMAAVTAAAIVVTTKTPFGRRVFAVGGNEDAARLSGVRVRTVKLWVYALSALAAGFAGIVQASAGGSVFLPLSPFHSLTRFSISLTSTFLPTSRCTSLTASCFISRTRSRHCCSARSAGGLAGRHLARPPSTPRAQALPRAAGKRAGPNC